jgi:Ca2+:H+ antiporter
MNIGSVTVEPLMLMLVFVPVSIALEMMHAEPGWIFVASSLAIIPLAGLMGKATEALAERSGPGIGGLLNATFGNAAEMIIALMALRQGLHDVVRASITGSIIGNILLVLGLSILVGGLKYAHQTFNRTASSVGSTLLALSAIGLVVPALFHLSVSNQPEVEHNLSLSIAIVLFITYLFYLFFSLRTHKHLYEGKSGHHVPHELMAWSVKKSVTMLFVAVAGVALMSEFLVGAVEPTAKAFGLTEVFVGVILVAIIGNAAEHSTAVLVAAKNQMDLAMNIAVGSSIQIALLVAPLLVFASYLFGSPMDLLFTSLEVVAVGLSVWILSLIDHDGETHWMEGTLLLAVYFILGVAFYFLP